MERLETKEILLTAVGKGATDLYLTPGAPPVLRVDSRLVKLHAPLLSAGDTERFARFLLSDEQWERFAGAGEIVAASSIPGVGRFRAAVYRQQGVCALSLRPIPDAVPSIEELGLPEAVKNLARCSQGLILVTGPTRSGKTTTLAALIDFINRERSCLVITLESPIEYLHRHQMSIVSQREVGEDTSSFCCGLRSALEQGADVIMAGELPDGEAVRAAISAAERGHLVLAGFPTLDATQTVERLIGNFPPDCRRQMMARLAASLQGVVSQRLYQRARGTGLVPAVEILIATPAVRSLIRDGTLRQLPSTIEAGGRYGMQTFAASLKRLCEEGIIPCSEALPQGR